MNWHFTKRRTRNLNKEKQRLVVDEPDHRHHQGIGASLK